MHMFPIFEASSSPISLSHSNLLASQNNMIIDSTGKNIGPISKISAIETISQESNIAHENFAIDSSNPGDSDMESVRNSNISISPNALENKNVVYIVLHFSALSDIKK